MFVKAKSVVYIVRLIKCLIILRHFESLSRFHISNKLQKKTEKGVLADFGRNSTHIDVENGVGTED